jgi:hypothetical protein
VIDAIMSFIAVLTQVEFYTYQFLFSRRIIESLLEDEGATITGLWSRQSGKTEAVADTALPLAIILPELAHAFPDDERFHTFAKGLQVGIYAFKDDKAGLPYRRMRALLKDKRNDEVDEEGNPVTTEDFIRAEFGIEVLTNRGDTLAFSNGSVIMARTASEQTNQEGETHHLIILEEAQKLSRSKVEKELDPMRSATHGTMVKIGTAWLSRGGFHHSIQQNEDDWKAGKKRNHFQFPYDLVIAERREAFKRTGNRFHLNYEKYIADTIRKLGGNLDSEEFKMNFRLLWQESRAIAISPTIFRAAAQRTLEAGPSRSGFQVAGLDIGKLADRTVLTVGDIDLSHPIVNQLALPNADEEKQVYYRKTITDWLELGGDFEGNDGQYARLVQYLAMTRVQVLVIDATSMGNPVYERINALVGGSIVCVPYVYGLVSKHDLYKYYIQEMHAKRVLYAAGPNTQQRYEYIKFVQEHEDLDRVLHGSHVVCEAPEGQHDDYPDSAAMFCWAEKVAPKVIMPDIQVDSGGGRGRSTRQLGGGNRQSRCDRSNRYARR